VVALSRTSDKRVRLAGLGATEVADPGDAEAVRAAVGPAGADVILDLVGASYWDTLFAALAERGRWIVVGTLGGSRVELDLGRLMRRRATLRGTVLRARGADEKAALTAAFRRDLLPRFADATLRPVVDRVLPLDDAAAAHRLLESGATFGKVVLRI
jgi:NADPH:quinone reductase-like Zn-dependent oxidoreductase